MKSFIALSVLLAFTVMHIDAYSGRPFVVQFQDQGDEDHHMEEPRFHTLYENQQSQDESLESKENSYGNAYLHEYSRREGPHHSSDSVQDMYNISEEYEKDSEDQHQEENYHHQSSEEQQHSKVYTKHIYAHDYSESASHSAESKSESKKHNVVAKKEKDCSSSEEKSEEHEPEPEPECGHCNKPKCEKCKDKKMVYVYKQPPIVVRPKPTNVYIKSKPIVVQPPPLVVHQPAQKPCNPVIQYKPPNIRVQPVIVKIKKAKTTTTTTTTPKPTTTCKPKTTTRKSCRKCRRKPTRKCNRCQKKKSRDYSVYYNGENIMT